MTVGNVNRYVCDCVEGI